MVHFLFCENNCDLTTKKNGSEPWRCPTLSFFVFSLILRNDVSTLILNHLNYVCFYAYYAWFENFWLSGLSQICNKIMMQIGYIKKPGEPHVPQVFQPYAAFIFKQRILDAVDKLCEFSLFNTALNFLSFSILGIANQGKLLKKDSSQVYEFSGAVDPNQT